MHHRQARLLLTICCTLQLFSVSHCIIKDQQSELEVDEVPRRQERDLLVPPGNDVLKDIDGERLVVNQVPVNVDLGQDGNHVESQQVYV